MFSVLRIDKPTRLALRGLIAVLATFGAAGCGLFGPSHDATHSLDHALNRDWYVAGVGSLGSPAFDGERAYFLDANHNVIAIDGQSGLKRWTASTQGTGTATYGDAGCAVASPVVVCGDDDLIGFRPSDGVILWRYHATVGYSPGFFSPTVRGSVIYAGSPSGTLYAIDAATGAERWVARPFPSDSELVSIYFPSADSDIVVAGFTQFLAPPTPPVGGVVAFDAATGAVRWISFYPQPPPSAYTSTNGMSTALWQDVVLGSSEAAGTIYALDRTTGAIRWTLPGVGNEPASLQGMPVTADRRSIAVSGSTAYVASESSWLVAYDLVAHAELWRFANPDGSYNLAPIAVDSNAVYIGALGGQLGALSTRGPKALWSAGKGAPDNFFGTVAIGSDRVFAIRVDGFYALPK